MRVIYERRHIPEYDRNEVHLKEGDIIAKCKIGDLIWNGNTKVIKRPLGIVTICNLTPDELGVEVEDCYSIIPIRTGLAKILNKERLKHLQPFMDGNDCCTFYVGKIEADYYDWDNVEVVRSVYDLN